MVLVMYADISINIPIDYLPLLTDLAYAKGFTIAPKLEDVETSLADPFIIEIDSEEFLELAELLVSVIE